MMGFPQEIWGKFVPSSNQNKKMNIKKKKKIEPMLSFTDISHYA